MEQERGLELNWAGATEILQLELIPPAIQKGEQEQGFLAWWSQTSPEACGQTG